MVVVVGLVDFPFKFTHRPNHRVVGDGNELMGQREKVILQW
jgi:hypothetical protein